MGFLDFFKKSTKGFGGQMFKSGTDVLKVGIGLGEQITKTTGSIVKPPLKLADKISGGFLTQMKKPLEPIPKAFEEKFLAPSMKPTDMVEQAMRGELKREDGSNILVEDLPWWAQAHYAAFRGPRHLGIGTLGSTEGGARFLEWQGLDSAKSAADKMKLWQESDSAEDLTGLETFIQAIGSSLPYYVAGQFAVGFMGIAGGIAPKIVTSAFGGSLAGLMEAGSEAGSVYQELKEKGYSQKEIDARASQNFWLNAIVISIMNTVSGLYEPGTGKTVKQQLFRMARAMPAEGIQEGIQTFLGNLATDKPALQGVLQSIGIGMLVAGVLGADASNISPQSQKKIQKMILDDRIINPKTVTDRLSDISGKVNMTLTGDPNQMTDLGRKIIELQKSNLEFVDSPGQFYSEVAKVIKENVKGDFNIKNIVDPVEGVGGFRSKGHLGGDMALGDEVLYITLNRETAEMYDRQTGGKGIDIYQYWVTPDEILDLSSREAYENYAKLSLKKYLPDITKKNAQGNAIRDLAKSEGYKVIIGDDMTGTAILDKSVLNPPVPKTSNELLERMLSVQSGLAGTVNDMWNTLKIDDALYETLDAEGIGLYIAKEEKAIVDNIAKRYKMTQAQAIKFVGTLFEAQAAEAQEIDKTPDVIKAGIMKAKINMGQTPDIIQNQINITTQNVDVAAGDVQLQDVDLSPARPTGTGDTVLVQKEAPQPISIPSSDFNIRNFTDNTAMEQFIQQQKAESLAAALEKAGYDGYRVDGEVVVTNKEALDEGMKSQQFITTEEALAQSKSFRFIQDMNIPVIMKERIRTDKGQQVFGRYSNQIIQFINNPHQTTIPHEAVHAFMDLMMTPEERSRILDEVRRRYPGKNYTDREASERLAQDFAEYFVSKEANGKATAPSSKLKKLFDWLIGKFKGLVEGTDKIQQFYKDVETKAPGLRQKREIGRRRVLRGGDALRDIQAAYYQNPEKFTLKFFNYKGLNRREYASYQFLMDLLKNAPLKQGEKDLITDVLSQPQFKNKENIRMQELKDAIIAEILPVEIIPTDRWANYGVDPMERTISKDLAQDIRMVKTYVLNTPFDHGYKGHFESVYSDFNIPDNSKGLLSHVRIAYMQEEDTAKVLEMQSDTIQKMSKEDLRTSMDSLASKYRQTVTSLTERQIDLGKNIKDDRANETELLGKIKDITVEITDLNQRIAALEAGNPKIEDLQQIKYSKQFITYYNIWHEITVKQAIRIAAMEGATSIQFPTAFTSSMIEGLIEQSEGDVGAEYTENDIKFGGDIEIYGELYKITQVYDNGGFNATNDMSPAISTFTQEQLQDEVTTQMTELPEGYGILESVKENILNDFDSWKADALERAKKLETVHGSKENADNAKKYIDGLNKSDIEKLNEENYRPESFELLFQPQLDNAIEKELDGFDFDAYLNGIYSFVSRNNFADEWVVADQDLNIQNFPPPSDPKLSTDTQDARKTFEEQTHLDRKTDRFVLLDEKFEAIAYRYQVTIPRYLAKLRGPENVKEVVDPYEFSWFETPIISEDKGAVEMFQTKESLQESEEDFELREEARKIVKEELKTEKKTVKQTIRAVLGKATQDKIERTEAQLLKLKLQNIAQGVKIGRGDMRVIMRDVLRVNRRVAADETKQVVSKIKSEFWEQEANIKVIKDAIVKYAEPLSNEEKGKLLNVVRDAKTTNNLDNAFSRIDAALFRVDKTEALAVLKKTVKKVKQVLKSGTGVAVDYQRQLADILEGYDLKKPTEKTIRQLESLQKFIEAQPVEESKTYFTDQDGQPITVQRSFVPVALQAEIKRLSKINAGSMTVQDIRDLNDSLLQLVSLGKLKSNLRNNNDERAREHNLESLVSSTNSIDPKGLLAQKRFDIRKSLRIDMLHAPRVTDVIDGYQDYRGQNTRWQRSVARAVDNSELEAKATISTALNQVNKVKEKWSKKEQATMMFYMLIDMGADTQAQTLIYAMGWKEMPTLTEEMATTMDIMRNTFESGVDTLQAISEEVTGKVFERVENYYPLKYQRGTTLLPDPVIGQKLQRSAKTKQGFTFARKKNVKKVVRIDVFAVFEEALREQIYFKNVQPVLYEIHSLVKDAQYQEAAGELATNWWKDYIDSVSNRGQLSGVRSSRLLKAARINLSRAILGYKVSSILIQPFAIIDALSYVYARFGAVKASKLLVHFAATWINPVYAKRVIAQSTALQLRNAGELAIAEMKTQNRGRGIINAYQRGSMKLLQWADVKTAAAVDQALYNIFKDKSISEEAARAEADLVMNLVSSTASIADRPMVLMKGEGWRTMLTFQTFMLNRWGMITHDLVRAGLVRGTLGRKARALIALFIIAFGAAGEDQVRRAIWRLLTGKDTWGGDEPLPDQIITDAVWSIPETAPVIGNIIRSRREWGMSFSVPLTRTIDNIATGFSMIASEKAETKTKGLLKISESLISLIGFAGTAQAFDFIERVFAPPKGSSLATPSSAYPELNGYAIPKIPTMPSIPAPSVPKMPNPYK